MADSYLGGCDPGDKDGKRYDHAQLDGEDEDSEELAEYEQIYENEGITNIRLDIPGGIPVHQSDVSPIMSSSSSPIPRRLIPCPPVSFSQLTSPLSPSCPPRSCGNFYSK